jgi:DNA-binding response OmpR family regulator
MTAPLILVAEAQPEMRIMVRRSLEESGFRTVPVENAVEMWSALDDMSPGAIVLDTALRKPNGTDLCREIRDRSDLPIILVGANSSEIDRVVGLELGADDYLSKPYSPRELVARLRAVLRRGRTEARNGQQRRQEARFEGWTVSFSRRTVTDAAGRAIDLTGAEFDLLAAMMEQAQRVIARERLMELSSPRGGESSDRSVDVLVSRLRRKLSGDGGSAPIVTVRGIGYMFSAPVEYR